MRQNIKEQANSFPEKITRQHALQIIANQLSTVKSETVPVAECCGRISAEALLSTASMPQHDRSAMDGFALASSATSAASVESPKFFNVSGEIRPTPSKQTEQESSKFPPRSPKSATKMLTGGIIPHGTDAVIPFEHVVLSGDKISVSAPVAAGEFIRKAGSDILLGEVLISENTEISACAAALLAYSGKYNIQVRTEPTVAVLAVGNELCDPAKAGEKGLIPADNLILMKGLCEGVGTGNVTIYTCENSPESIAKAIEKHSSCDLIITTGGTGPGNRDFVFNSIHDAGGKPLFKGLAMHPAKSIFAFKMNNTAILGLPGPPNAVHLAFHTVIKPVINILLGLPERSSSITANLADSITGSSGREKLIPCRIESDSGKIKATPIDYRNLSSRKAMCLANGIIIIPADCDMIEAGSLVEVIIT